VTSASRPALAAVLLLLFWLPPAEASDRDLLTTLSREYAAVRVAAAAARGGVAGPDAVQRQYDTARELEMALDRAQPVSASCRPLLRALRSYSDAQIAQAEGFDRRDPNLAARGRELARRAEERVNRTRRSCRPAEPEARPETPPLAEPGPNEAFFGLIRARAPASATDAGLFVDGRLVARAKVHAGWSRFDIQGAVAPGRHELEVRFDLPRSSAASARTTDAWLMPRSALSARPGRAAEDARLARQVARLGRGFRGYAGILIRDLRTGAVAQWNADARFPAASTVKVGVLVAALARFGTSTTHRYDLVQMTEWSSNLAANRLVRLLGQGSEERGSTVVEATLRRLGATRSTYTGLYRVGTASSRSSAEPPSVSRRVTTAGDLATIMATIHAAALGDVRALQATRLTVPAARLALGLLLGASAEGDSAGLVRPFIGERVLVARKEGWLRDARHTVALAYPVKGPLLVSILTYRAGLTLEEARQLGRSVVRAAGL